MVMGEDMEVSLEEGVEMSENCGDVERRRKILNNSSWGRAHDPVLSLSFGKPKKESPKSGLLNQAVG